MTQHPWIAALALALLLGCGASVPPPAEPVDDEGPQTYAVALRLEDAGADEHDTPRTRVSLVKIAPDGARTVEVLHTELGACWHETDVEGVLIAARCWWGGAGARYAIARVGDTVIARRRDVDEQTGDAGWVQVGGVEVPEGARLQVLAPGRRAELPTEPRR